LSEIEALRQQISAIEDLNIFTTIDWVWLEKHLENQRKIDGPLSGKWIVIKDNINVAGLPVTCGSKILNSYIAPYNATVIEKILAAGGIIIGKANMDEFAMGSSNEYSAFGAVKNPVNPDYVPGGSSGGSAAAVASGIADYALGSDTGGSIRQPAAYTGTVGLKPTYGRVSRYGLTAFASSLDQIGPITKNVSQAAALLEVIAGHDPRDATSAKVPVEPYSRLLQKAPDKKIRIGVPDKLLQDGIAPEIRSAFEKTVDLCRAAGFDIVNVELPNSRYAIAAYYILATAEASSNLARFDGVRYGHRSDKKPIDITDFFALNREEGFGDEVKRRIMLGTYVLSSGYYDAYYGKAQKVRRLIYDDFQAALTNADVIVMPTTPAPAFRLGEKCDDPLEMYLNDVFTVSVNIAGIPAMSLPMGNTQEGLPMGFQIIGRPFEEGTILQLGHFIEEKYE
jgi:aspartyl-tRNA(Asn)/glutamyl-tRNA(Gln) amidotransferase subunit A